MYTLQRSYEIIIHIKRDKINCVSVECLVPERLYGFFIIIHAHKIIIHKANHIRCYKFQYVIFFHTK